MTRIGPISSCLYLRRGPSSAYTLDIKYGDSSHMCLLTPFDTNGTYVRSHHT